MMGSVVLSWGKYTGFYIAQWRISLGWLSFSYADTDILDLIERCRAKLKKAKLIQEKLECQLKMQNR